MVATKKSVKKIPPGMTTQRIRKAIKKCKIGLEAEMFTLDHNGNVVNSGNELIKATRDQFPDVLLAPECGKNMLEVLSHPEVRLRHTMGGLLQNFEDVLVAAEKLNLKVLPLGCYPGVFTPEIQANKNYKIKEQIFGKQRFSIAGRCVGFHCHYTLPWGVFDSVNLFIKQLVKSKNIKTMVNSYNLLIAMDPALTTFMQSSPFYQGKFIGKDSRVIVYRGGEVFNYPQGLYANYPDFGALQWYEHTSTDLIDFIKRKYDGWKENLKRLGINLRVLTKHASVLDTAWNPVKVNANGTLEQRGSDMNHPMMIAASTTVIKYILQEVKDEHLEVEPSEIGLKHPFKIEGSKLYIPPDTFVRRTLQPQAAFHGLENKEVYNYCKALLRLAKKLSRKNKKQLLKPFDDMLTHKKTVSDEILAFAKKKGYNAKKAKNNEPLPQDIARKIALDHSTRLYKEIMLCKQAFQKLD